MTPDPTITFNLGKLNAGTWARYIFMPSDGNLFDVFAEVVESWDFEGDPSKVESYRALSQDEQVFVSKMFGMAMVEFNERKEAAQRAKSAKKKKPRLKRKKREDK